MSTQTMHALKARVENGRYVIDEPAALPEGAEVQLQVITGDELDDKDRAAPCMRHLIGQRTTQKRAERRMLGSI